MNYLSNAFSLNMVQADMACMSMLAVEPGRIPTDAVSVVGHADTAAVLSSVLGRDIPFNRQSLSLEMGDVLYVAQYSGPRLPEGATSLPEGAAFRFLRVEVRTSALEFVDQD